MEANISEHNNVLNVQMHGSFTFNDNQAFRELIKTVESKREISRVELDFQYVEFIDSAALGMLLLIRDAAAKMGIKIALVKAHGQTKKMFDLSKFDELFTIVNG